MANHFLRDVAKPVLEVNNHAKVQMRRKVRGLRAIEQDILASRTAVPIRSEEDTKRNEVGLEYCAAVRGILNKNQGGPLDPPGLRLAQGLPIGFLLCLIGAVVTPRRGSPS